MQNRKFLARQQHALGRRRFIDQPIEGFLPVIEKWQQSLSSGQIDRKIVGGAENISLHVIDGAGRGRSKKPKERLLRQIRSGLRRSATSTQIACQITPVVTKQLLNIPHRARISA